MQSIAPYRWPEPTPARALVLGLGGGADVPTAHAVAAELPAGLTAYGNAKTRPGEDPVARARSALVFAPA